MAAATKRITRGRRDLTQLPPFAWENICTFLLWHDVSYVSKQFMLDWSSNKFYQNASGVCFSPDPESKSSDKVCSWKKLTDSTPWITQTKKFTTMRADELCHFIMTELGTNAFCDVDECPQLHALFPLLGLLYDKEVGQGGRHAPLCATVLRYAKLNSYVLWLNISLRQCVTHNYAIDTFDVARTTIEWIDDHHLRKVVSNLYFALSVGARHFGRAQLSRTRSLIEALERVLDVANMQQYQYDRFVRVRCTFETDVNVLNERDKLLWNRLAMLDLLQRFRRRAAVVCLQATARRRAALAYVTHMRSSGRTSGSGM